MFGDDDGKSSGRSLENSRNEAKKEQKICQKSVPNRTGCVAKPLVELPSAKEIHTVTNVYSATVVCLERNYSLLLFRRNFARKQCRQND